MVAFHDSDIRIGQAYHVSLYISMNKQDTYFELTSVV